MYWILKKKEGMFKYNISVTFHCFTQYYGKSKRYYEINSFFKKRSIFLRALYKKGGVGEPALMQEFPGYFHTPNRLAVHRLVRLALSGYRKCL